MKLVLLPGMDGTGVFFRPMLRHLKGIDSQTIPLPQQGPQDYSALVDFVERQLPEGDFVLLAESFSGEIARCLVARQLPNLKGVIFVVSFLSNPAGWLPGMACKLPLSLGLRLPGAGFLMKRGALDKEAHAKRVEEMLKVLRALDESTLKARLNQIAGLKSQVQSYDIPAVYLGANQDVLVTRAALDDFKVCFPSLDVEYLNGPHMLLLCEPQKSAQFLTGVLARFGFAQ